MIAVTMAVTAGIYAIMDYTQCPKFMMKYKVQTGKNVPPNTKKMMKVPMHEVVKCRLTTTEKLQIVE